MHQRPDSPPCDLVRIRPDASPFALWGHLHACARHGLGTAWESHVAAVRAAQAADAPGGPADAAPAEEAAPRGADLGPGRVPVPGEPQDAASFDAAHDLACLLANAESEAIAVTWCERAVGRPRPDLSGPAVGASPFWLGAGRRPGSWDPDSDDEVRAAIVRDRELVEAGR